VSLLSRRMFRHVVTLTLLPDAPAAARDEIVTALRTLPAQVPSIRGYAIGTDAGIDDGNADIVVVADFDDADGYVAYRDDPTHRQMIRDLILPVLAARSAVQHLR